MVSVCVGSDFVGWHCCSDLRKAAKGPGSELFGTTAATSLVSVKWSSSEAHLIVVEGLH